MGDISQEWSDPWGRRFGIDFRQIDLPLTSNNSVEIIRASYDSPKLIHYALWSSDPSTIAIVTLGSVRGRVSFQFQCVANTPFQPVTVGTWGEWIVGGVLTWATVATEILVVSVVRLPPTLGPGRAGGMVAPLLMGG